MTKQNKKPKNVHERPSGTHSNTNSFHLWDIRWFLFQIYYCYLKAPNLIPEHKPETFAELQTSYSLAAPEVASFHLLYSEFILEQPASFTFWWIFLKRISCLYFVLSLFCFLLFLPLLSWDSISACRNQSSIKLAILLLQTPQDLRS